MTFLVLLLALVVAVVEGGGDVKVPLPLYAQDGEDVVKLERRGETRQSAEVRGMVSDYLFTFDEYYHASQYGDIFGYYSTGRIVKNKETFQSFTTFPMALSPHFGMLVTIQLVTLWNEMGSPKPFHLFEFGAGTAQLAKDILLAAQTHFPAFFDSLVYVIGERAAALVEVQEAALVEYAGKVTIFDIDVRDAGGLRRFVLNDAMLAGTVVNSIRGVVLSNELIDAFEPFRLHLRWKTSSPPTILNDEIENLDSQNICAGWLEVAVVHLAPVTVIEALFEDLDKVLYVYPREVLSSLVEQYEANGLFSDLARDILDVDNYLAVIFAVDEIVNDAEFDFEDGDPILRRKSFGLRFTKAVEKYETEFKGLVMLPKDLYNKARELVKGKESAELGFLQQVNTREIFVPVTKTRCDTYFASYLKRNAKSIEALVQFQADRGEREVHFSMRPGEEDFVNSVSDLLDEGFIFSIDYGADQTSLYRHSVLAEYPGYIVLDSLDKDVAQFCGDSRHRCPGLSDLTSHVDFTNLALAGQEVGLSTVFYGPQFLLDRVLPHEGLNDSYFLLEKADKTAKMKKKKRKKMRKSLQAWYGHDELDEWGSFKVLIQRKGGSHTSSSDFVRPGINFLPLSTDVNDFTTYCNLEDVIRPPVHEAFLHNTTVAADDNLIYQVHHDAWVSIHFAVILAQTIVMLRPPAETGPLTEEQIEVLKEFVGYYELPKRFGPELVQYVFSLVLEWLQSGVVPLGTDAAAVIAGRAVCVAQRICNTVGIHRRI